MPMNNEQRAKIEEHLKKNKIERCAACGSGKLSVDLDPVGPQVWQPKVEGATEGIYSDRTYAFAVVRCDDCSSCIFFPWGLVVGFDRSEEKSALGWEKM